MYQVGTALWYVLYQAVVLAVPTFGSCRTTCWYTPYQLLVHAVPAAGTPQNLRTYPNNSRPLGRQALATVRALL